MWSPRRGSQPRPGRGLAVWAALTAGGLLPSAGCQVEYAGMTLPSGKYMHDDVQYFAPGTDFPWANTQAATQRARMQQQGMEIPPPGQGGPLTITPAEGALPRVQNRPGGRFDNINAGGLEPMPAPTPPPPGAAPPPGDPQPPGAGDMPAVPAPGGAGEPGPGAAGVPGPNP